MSNQIHDISVQRNELRRCLEQLCDKIIHGAHNHMFKETNSRAFGEDKKVCENGHKRDEVIWCQGRCCGDCDGCAKDCQLSFEEKRLFDVMKAAQSVLDKPDAEMPPVAPKDFPVYSPDAHSYQATDRWIARSFYRFAVGYWVFANHKDQQQEKEWERAFDDLLAMSLNAIGKDGRAVSSFFNGVRDVESRVTDREQLKKEAEKLRDDNPEAVKLIDEAVQFVHDRKNKDYTVTRLVFYALMIRMDYNFGHQYPGGDMDVYDGAFCGLIDIALKIVGLDSDDEPRQDDDESNEAYALRLAEFKSVQREKIYAFMSETDGLTVCKL